MKNYGNFLINDLDSADYGIVITEAPPVVLAEREVDTVSVAGASGDLHIDMGRYKNVKIPYKCAIVPLKGKTLRETVEAAAPLLQPTAGYRRMENSFSPGYFRMCRISSEISVESIVERAGRFTVELDCKPQKYLKDGTYPIPFSSAGTISNPFSFPAVPIITVYGSGAGTLTVGDISVELLSVSDYITLDCEMQNAYRLADGIAENMNRCISAETFPVLEAGDSTVQWSGDIEKIEIIPRWWTL